jgi:hypothetical protein
MLAERMRNLTPPPPPPLFQRFLLLGGSFLDLCWLVVFQDFQRLLLPVFAPAQPYPPPPLILPGMLFNFRELASPLRFAWRIQMGWREHPRRYK